MVKRLKTTIAVLLGCVLSFLMVPNVFAAETSDKGVSVQIPVSCIGENTDEVFTYTLTKSPVNTDSAIEQKSITLKNGEKGTFTLSYNLPATYHYEVYQNAGGDKDTTYDDTKYMVDVYVTEDEKGVLSAETIAYKKDSTEKISDLGFTNVKVLPTNIPEITPESTPEITPKVTKAPVMKEPIKNVKTGDTTDILGVIALTVLSGIVIAVLIVLIAKEGKDNEKKK